MEGATLGLLSGGGGGGDGSSRSSTFESTVSKVDVVEKDHYVDATSCPAESELELGLALSLGVGGYGGGGDGKGKASAWGESGRIFTAEDFPSVLPHAHGGANASGSSGGAAVSGTKRAADSSPQESGFPTGGSQVVGWPPIGVHRMSSLVNQTKALKDEEDKSTVVGKDKSKDVSKKKLCNGNKNSAANENGSLAFVKVNVDGVPIGRKVDLNAHTCYETLAQTLEDMFFRSSPTLDSIGSGGEKEQEKKTSKLFDGSSGFVLTYEDKDEDWMLVGDVPWRMFYSSVKRLRIMRTSEANGLGM